MVNWAPQRKQCLSARIWPIEPGRDYRYDHSKFRSAPTPLPLGAFLQSLVDKDPAISTVYRRDKLRGAEKAKGGDYQGVCKLVHFSFPSSSLSSTPVFSTSRSAFTSLRQLDSLAVQREPSRRRTQLSQDQTGSTHLPFLNMRFTTLIVAIVGFAITSQADCTPGTRCCKRSATFRGHTFCADRGICNDLGQC
ncbi:unnamed protein product [Zymoseptoria tritici ST99CH_1E4]|uniref:Uncharacterized protein n=1 Tax=Zymoseptoria tritici ST99CH_1E4 TaxID=1276532 RepID=A0A2H1GNY8_ZYMTR|nr:unnamed protein product [Zymoseptoria tritici ST99CH_1E4]